MIFILKFFCNADLLIIKIYSTFSFILTTSSRVQCLFLTLCSRSLLVGIRLTMYKITILQAVLSFLPQGLETSNLICWYSLHILKQYDISITEHIETMFIVSSLSKISIRQYNFSLEERGTQPVLLRVYPGYTQWTIQGARDVTWLGHVQGNFQQIAVLVMALFSVKHCFYSSNAQ